MHCVTLAERRATVRAKEVNNRQALVKFSYRFGGDLSGILKSSTHGSKTIFGRG